MNQNTNSYSHDHPYPLQQRFFIEPKTARGAIKCDVTVSDVTVSDTSHLKLASCLVLPYSPTSKDATPEPARAADMNSMPSSRTSTGPPSQTGNNSFLHNRQAPVTKPVNYPAPSLQSDDIGTMVWVILFIFLSVLFVFVLCNESCWQKLFYILCSFSTSSSHTIARLCMFKHNIIIKATSI